LPSLEPVKCGSRPWPWSLFVACVAVSSNKSGTSTGAVVVDRDGEAARYRGVDPYGDPPG
jgi:hypothetical protein